MKKTLLALALLSIAAAARAATGDGNTSFAVPARSPEPATLTTIVKSSETVVAVSISTTGPTSIVQDVAQVYRWVEVQNCSATDIVCDENSVALSTQTATFWGWTVSALANSTCSSKRFDIVPGTDFFCWSKAAAVAVKVAVYRGR